MICVPIIGCVPAFDIFSENSKAPDKFNVSDKPIKILRGQPLMQIIPFVRAEYEFENNVPENLDEIDMLNIAQRAIIDDEDSHLKVNRIPKNYNAQKNKE